MVESSTSSTPKRVDSSASVSSSATSTTSNTAQQTPSSLITALPTEEALQILLSPDGYYKYLQIAKPPPDAMGLKYQAAMSAGGGEVEGKGTEIDLDQVKKNYRRLSLKHHPDRKTGDAECFRMLNRAKIVLSNNKLRREYDLVGLDLDDDVDDPDHHTEETHASSTTTSGGTKENGESNKEEEKDNGSSSKTETVMGHLASATLTAVLQVVVRTGLMGAVSSIISRYTILTVIAIGMLTFLTYKLYQTVKTTLGPGVKLTFASLRNALSPLVIAFGIFSMYRGRSFVVDTSSITDNAVIGDSTTANAETITTYLDWSWTFWLGETIVMTSFITNSLEKTPRPVLFICIVLSLLLSLWLRGRFWRYATLLGFEGIIALLVVLAFPIMEMILESIVEEKMRKATRFENEGNVEEEEGTEVADVDYNV